MRDKQGNEGKKTLLHGFPAFFPHCPNKPEKIKVVTPVQPPASPLRDKSPRLGTPALL